MAGLRISRAGRRAAAARLEGKPFLRCQCLQEYDPNAATAIEQPAARVAMITAAHCRSARALLGWSLAKLAAAASVSERDIDDFERERRVPDAASLDAIEHAFTAVGVAFSPDGDMRLVNLGHMSV